MLKSHSLTVSFYFLIQEQVDGPKIQYFKDNFSMAAVTLL